MKTISRLHFIKGETVHISGKECFYVGFDREAQLYGFRDALSQEVDYLSFQDVYDRWENRQFHRANEALREVSTDTPTPLMKLTPAELEEVRSWKRWIDVVDQAERNAGCSSRKVVESALMDGASQKNVKAPSYSNFCKMRKRFRNYGLAGLVKRIPCRGNRNRRTDPEVREIVEKVVAKNYLTKDRLNVQFNVERIQKKIENLNALREGSSPLSLPNYSYVYRYIQSLNQYEVAAARYGKQYARRHYGIFGQGLVAELPNDHWQIDHNLVDVLIVDPSRSVVIGRPWLTLVIDVCTRMIVGFHLSFSDPSYWSVAQCLKHAIRPKDYVSEVYPDIKNPWPACGRPYELTADRGSDLTSELLANLLFEVGIDLNLTRRRTPTDKAIVERVFRTMNEQFFHSLKGTTFSHVLNRGEYASENMACMTTDSFLEALHIYIVDYYNTRIHRSLHHSPLDAWNKGMQEAFVDPLVDFTNWDYVFAKRIPNKPVHSYGIEHGGIKYSSPELAKIRSHKAKRGHGENRGAEIRENPDDLSYIYVTDPNDGSIYHVPATDISYAGGLNRYLQKKILEERNRAKKDEGLLLSLAEARDRIVGINDAEFKKRPMKTHKKAARTKGIRFDTATSQKPKNQRVNPSRDLSDLRPSTELLRQHRPNEFNSDHSWEVYND